LFLCLISKKCYISLNIETGETFSCTRNIKKLKYINIFIQKEEGKGQSDIYIDNRVRTKKRFIKSSLHVP